MNRKTTAKGPSLKEQFELEKKGTKGMRPREFARAYGLSEGAVYRGIRAGTIPAVEVGRRLVVLPEEFEKLAQA